MSTLLDAFFDIIRQGLPTIGAIGGLTWATADGTSRNRSKMLSRGLLGATIGWGAGYAARVIVLNVIDSGSPNALPSNVASLGPSSGNLGYTEPGTMPNPTQHPEPFAKAPDLPKSQFVDGETNQNLNIAPNQTDIDVSQGEAVQIQGSLSSDAFGTV